MGHRNYNLEYTTCKLCNHLKIDHVGIGRCKKCADCKRFRSTLGPYARDKMRDRKYHPPEDVLMKDVIKTRGPRIT